MKNRRMFFLFIVLFLFASVGAAQDQRQADIARPASDGPPARGQGERPNLLRELGLSREQLQQMRKMNIERKPQMEAAQRSLRDSIAALDAAIYADTVNEETVAARIKDFQAAQAEIARIRFNSELTVRQILTPEQLIKFRELRKRFEEERSMRRRNRKDGGLPLFQKMNRQNRRPGNGP
jgi:Spy/CpxP family protein refolding chaperone